MAGRSKFLPGLLALLCCGSAQAAESGESVVLVYNSRSAASKRVADHYAARRNVPAGQIVALDLPETETISREEFESKLQNPLWNELRQRQLLTYRPKPANQGVYESNVTQAKVRYAVLCYGVPVKITADPGRREEGAESIRPELRRNEAAVDSELAALPLLDRKLPLLSFIPNPVFGATNAAALQPSAGLLMTARLDGPTPELALGLVDKALEAERTGLWGRACFDLRGLTDGPHRAGDEWMHNASEVARLYGFESQVDRAGPTFSSRTPLEDIALYFGWYDQSVSGPFTNGLARFRPGAVAYHLHSFSARTLRVSDVWWAGPLIALGATATMGCTEEPYLETTPQPNVFLSRLVLLGFSFGEAAYAAQMGLSWQNTVVGDPLYRPFAKSQKDRFEELEARRDPNLEWSILMYINYRLAQGAPLEEIVRFYDQTPLCARSALLQEKLGDLYNARGKIFDAVEPYSNALRLPATPLQRLRLAFSAGTLFISLSKNEEAYALFQGVLRDFPDYPDKRGLYERLHKLAQRLERAGEAAEYERLARQG